MAGAKAASRPLSVASAKAPDSIQKSVVTANMGVPSGVRAICNHNCNDRMPKAQPTTAPPSPSKPPCNKNINSLQCNSSKIYCKHSKYTSKNLLMANNLI